MNKQEEIREGIAQYNYYYPDGKPRIRKNWGLLSVEEKKPYLDVARLQVFKLHSQGVVIKVDRELPKCVFHEDQMLMEVDCPLHNAGYEAVEPLIKTVEADIKQLHLLSNLINRHSMENKSNTPDFILAQYLSSCLNAFEVATQKCEA